MLGEIPDELGDWELAVTEDSQYNEALKAVNRGTQVPDWASSWSLNLRVYFV